jgi:hypothetical protein
MNDEDFLFPLAIAPMQMNTEELELILRLNQ